MGDVVPDGARVRVYSRNLYWPGDVLLIARNGQVFSHRFLGYFIGRKGLAVITRADIAEGADGPSHHSTVLGRVEKVFDCQFQVKIRHRFAALIYWFQAMAGIVFLKVSAWVKSRP